MEEADWIRKWDAGESERRVNNHQRRWRHRAVAPASGTEKRTVLAQCRALV